MSRAQPRFDKEITSASNAVFKTLTDCLTSKGIKKHELFFVFGRRAVRDTLEQFPRLVRDLLVSTEAFEDSETLALIEKTRATCASAAILNLSPTLFKEIDLFGTHEPILALKTPQTETIDLSLPPQGLEILCALSDPSNLGALLRSAAAFGASRIVLLQESASPFHPRAVRAASATTLLTPLAKGPSIKDLSTTSVAQPLIVLDMNGTDVSKFKWPRHARLLLGEEGQGVPRLPGANLISIAMRPEVESLNATVAASIALYAYQLANKNA